MNIWMNNGELFTSFLDSGYDLPWFIKCSNATSILSLSWCQVRMQPTSCQLLRLGLLCIPSGCWWCERKYLPDLVTAWQYVAIGIYMNLWHIYDTCHVWSYIFHTAGFCLLQLQSSTGKSSPHVLSYVFLHSALCLAFPGSLRWNIEAAPTSPQPAHNASNSIAGAYGWLSPRYVWCCRHLTRFLHDHG